MKKGFKLVSFLPLFFVFCFFCLGMAFPKNVALAKTDDFEAFSKSFQTMMQNASDDYDKPIYINLDHDASLIDSTYMMDIATFSDITDVDVNSKEQSVEISNEFASLSFFEDENQEENQTAKFFDGELFVPLTEVASNLGFEVEINQNTATLTRPYQTKRVVVETSKQVKSAEASYVAEGYGNLHIFQYETESQTKDAFNELKNNYPDALVYLDSVVSIDDTQASGLNDDFSYKNTWGVQATGAKEYSTFLLNSVDVSSLPEIVVAVLDTGIDTDHPWFANRISLGGASFVSGSKTSDYEDDHWHGTHVSGTIVDMTLENVKILPIKILNSNGEGNFVNIRVALEYVLTQKESGLNIVAINMSLGTESTESNGVKSAYQKLITEAYEQGILCVAAAGNDSKDASSQSPANVPLAITVSAIKSDYVFDYSYSNFGDDIDFCAPGTNITSAKMGGGTTTQSGTSMATPHISALIALLYSDTNQTYTPDSIFEKLKECSVDLGSEDWDKYYGFGLPNIKYAYSTALKNVEFSQTDENFTESFSLTLSHSNELAKIYYTTDGTEPSTTNGTLYETPILIDKTTTVKATAFILDGDSVVSSSITKSMTYICDNTDFDENFVVQNGVITAYNGTLTTLKIPETINGQTITKIGQGAFASSSCSVIYLPQSVEEIETQAFYQSSLTEIFAPGVKTIGTQSFAKCFSLVFVDDEHFPELTNIGKYAFYGCYNLESITLSKVTFVDSYAFLMESYQNSTKLSQVSMKEARTLNAGAFYYCLSLKQVDLPKCQIVSSNAFYCTGLIQVSLPSAVLVGSCAFSKCSNLESVDLPEAITVGDSCFANLTNLSSVNLEKLQMAGAYAFYGCLKIETLNLSELSKAGAYAFAECEKLANFDFSNLRQIDFCAFLGTTFEEINLPSLTQISKNAFSENSNLKTVKLSSNLQVFDSPFDKSSYEALTLYVYDGTPAKSFADENSIKYFLLDSTSNLTYYIKNKKVFLTGFVDNKTEIIIPETINGNPVETICANAFSGALNLTKIISQNLKTIQESAFENCTNLKTFECYNVQTIKNNAFLGCSNLSNLTISNATQVGEKAFYGCDSLSYAMLFGEVTSLGEKCFGYKSDDSLNEDFVLYGKADSVVSDYAQENNITFYLRYSDARWYFAYTDDTQTDVYISKVDESNYGRLAFPETITYGGSTHTVVAIGNSAFENCSLITEISLPSTITNIGQNAFENCSMLRSINLENITNLGGYAFYGCTSLVSANLKSLNSIPVCAFMDCYNLLYVNAQNTKQVGAKAFCNCFTLESIKLTNAQILGTFYYALSLYGEVFANCKSLSYVALPNIQKLGTNLFNGAGTKDVVLSSSQITTIYNNSISTDITIYGYENSTAQSYANKNSITFTVLSEFKITSNLSNQATANLFDNLILEVQSSGNFQTYEWFKDGNKLNENSNTLSVDTSTEGTFSYVVEITNFDGTKLVSNVCTVTVTQNSTVCVDYEICGVGSSSLVDGNLFDVGTSPKITFEPQIGWHLSELWVDGSLLGDEETVQASQNGYVFENIETNHNLKIVYEKKLSTVTFSVSGNGSLSKTNFTTTCFDETIVTIIPDQGYELSEIKMDGQNISGLDLSGVLQNGFVVKNITKNTIFEVVFNIKTFDITTKVNDETLGNATSSQKVNYNQNLTINFELFAGVYLKELRVDGTLLSDEETEQASQNGYVFENVTENHTLEVVFAKIVYEIKVEILGKGSVTNVTGETQVFYGEYGEDVTLTLIPAEGYEIFNVLINGQPVDKKGSSLTIHGIQENKTLTVVFQKISLQVTIEHSENGSVGYGKIGTTSNSTIQQLTLQYGDTVCLQIAPNEGYGIDYITINNVFQTVAKTLNFVIKENTQIYVQFANEFQITSSAEGSGEISQNEVASFGESKTFLIKAQQGYVIEDVLVDGKSVGAVESYTFENVDTRHTILAVFGVETFTIKTQISGSGAIVVDNLEPAQAGESRTFHFVPQDGFALSKVYVNDKEVQVQEDNSITIIVEENIVVKAVFEESGHLKIVIILSSCIAGVCGLTLILAIFIALKRNKKTR